jgi:hypothetical protein
MELQMAKKSAAQTKKVEIEPTSEVKGTAEVLVAAPVEDLLKGGCMVCGNPVKDHTVSQVTTCLKAFAFVKPLEKPATSLPHAMGVTQRLQIPLTVGQDQADFIVSISGNRIETKDPARAICDWLLENYAVPVEA